MDRLWTPWRYNYITGQDERTRRSGVPRSLDAWPAELDHHCVFCNMIAAADYAIAHGMPQQQAEGAIYLLARYQYCYLCLNAYPYSTGHLMVVPYAHQASLADLPEPAALEMMRLAQRVERCLRSVYHPDGLNFGLNLGQAAGAGVAGHLHLHALPRWTGDANFMTAIAETRVLPETLETTWSKLRAALAADSAT
ncbi:MAG: HIT domain-containing protein [Acidobacteriota bacterium]|nr:HIT domain-containing protein [Acidobacteriota bacterium]